ncbi:hypothetical protein [Sphingorhabdus sp.]|jgi:hypothetical protein|uniref:hypothetical protein n=1 Tax=Sphingorhabdus sp. TaxID=1902408 RepID=UPI003BAEDCC5|nr:hypothetical protein [Sphingomonadales bacterium]MBK9432583.1 hypothetical protein [Sphingomonadales bacterium]MBL0021889.1 hypothetical protein [Sphingomonadales bacterium]
MFDRLKAAADHMADRALMRVIERMAANTPPNGLELERRSDCLLLKGRRLKRRMIDNPLLRNFWR